MAVKKSTVVDTLPEVIYEMQDLMAELVTEFEVVINERKGWKIANKRIRKAIIKLKKCGIVYRKDSLEYERIIKLKGANKGSFKKKKGPNSNWSKNE